MAQPQPPGQPPQMSAADLAKLIDLYKKIDGLTESAAKNAADFANQQGRAVKELTRLEKEWSDEERQLIKRIIEGLLYYKRILPRSLKDDIVSALQLCNRLKHQLDILIGKVGELENFADHIQIEI
jgi:uncharacterized protein Yka (UPF0111/DUF47 family)